MESTGEETEKWTDGILRTADEIASNLDEAMDDYSKLCQVKADLAARASFSKASEFL